MRYQKDDVLPLMLIVDPSNCGSTMITVGKDAMRNGSEMMARRQKLLKGGMLSIKSFLAIS
jgi:hypothetical protein